MYALLLSTGAIICVTAMSTQLILEQKWVGWSKITQLTTSMYINGQTLQSFTVKGTFIDQTACTHLQAESRILSMKRNVHQRLAARIDQKRAWKMWSVFIGDF